MTMDYGPNWAPKPRPPSAPVRKRRRFSLWQRCVMVITGYTLIALGGLAKRSTQRRRIRR